MWSFKEFLVQLLFGMDFHRSCQCNGQLKRWTLSIPVPSSLCCPKYREGWFSLAERSQQQVHFDQTDEARHLPIPRPASRTSMDPYVNILGSFLFPFKRSQHKGHRQILSAGPTISLFLVLDFWYDIPPPHPRTLRRTYSYLPDCANLFE
jgi:hypothetical protein